MTWCIEQHKVHKGIDGQASMELLDRYGVLDYLKFTTAAGIRL